MRMQFASTAIPPRSPRTTVPSPRSLRMAARPVMRVGSLAAVLLMIPLPFHKPLFRPERISDRTFAKTDARPAAQVKRVQPGCHDSRAADVDRIVWGRAVVGRGIQRERADVEKAQRLKRNSSAEPADPILPHIRRIDLDGVV